MMINHGILGVPFGQAQTSPTFLTEKMVWKILSMCLVSRPQMGYKSC